MPVNRLTPFGMLVAAGVVAVAGFAASLSFVLNQPWLGLSLLPAEDGLVVEAVDELGPSAGIVFASDTLKALLDRNGEPIPFSSEDMIEDPDEFAGYEQYNDFMRRQDILSAELRRGVVTVLSGGDLIVRIQPEPVRPLSSLPVSFWLNHFFAFIALAISAGIWTARRDTIATWFLFISGAGLFAGATFSSLYITRELALPAESFHWLSEANSISNRVFCIFGLGLLWYYPRPLATISLFVPVAAIESLYMVNELYQWFTPPLHAFYLDLPAMAVIAVSFGIWRWLQSRGDALERAIVKWFLLSILLSVGLVMFVFVLPVILGREPLLAVSGSYTILLVMYVGLAMGVLRYRLFDIDCWWREMWLWFFAGLAIVALDIFLVALAGVASSYALIISILFTAWLYFPARQWLWGRLFHQPQRSLELYVPLLLRNVMQPGNDAMDLWQKVLSEVFQPLSIESKSFPLSDARIIENGIRMQVPCLLEGCCMELYYAEKGKRLFNRDDIEFAQALFSISKSSMAQRESYVKGMLDERKRIMRDLHDDVGGRLLTLTHAEQGGSATASDALKSLREIIYALDVEQQPILGALVARLRIEALERCEAAGIAFEWEWEEAGEDTELSPRHALNLTLILREALSNVFTHAKATGVSFRLRLENGSLHARICNDGVNPVKGSVKQGKGLGNMNARIRELGGGFSFDCTDQEFCVQFSVPLPEEMTDA